ncbi:T9SS sorting signal type C domain-containing protein [Flavobacterium nackdongense]|nr:T9SS sorting signal type C domain-containing protein [Flavobacterium nackdongense]
MKALSFSKNRCSSLLGLIFLLFATAIATAATRTSTATGGAWATGSTWVGGVAPAAGDDVIIATTGANSVSLGANASITNVTINAGATLNIANRRLTVAGFFTNNGTVTGTTGQVNLTAAGNFNNSGSFNLTTGRISTTTGNFSSTGSLTYSGAGFLVLGGAFTYSGIFTLGAAQVQFIGNADQSIPAFTTTGIVSMLKTGGTATLTGNVTAGGLTLNGAGGTLDLVSGTHTFSGAWTRTNGNLNGGSSLLRIGGSATGTGGTGIYNLGTGTVEYYGGVNQTVAPVIYNNLTLTGTGTKSIATATTTVNKVLAMEGQAVASAAPTYAATATLQYNIAVARTIGAEWITPFAAAGGVVINGNQNTTLNGAKVFNAGIPLTINSGAKLLTGANSLSLGGDFINNGGTFTSTGPIIITNTMATQSIAGFTTTGLVSMTKTSGTATFTGNVSGAGITMNGSGGTLNLGSSLTHTFSGAVNLTAGTLNGGSSLLNVNFTGIAWTGTGSNFNAGTGTVNFGGAGQTLSTSSTFNNLTFSASGTKTLTGLPTVNGILSMEGTSSVSAAPTYGAAATLQYNRTLAQVTGPEWITTFTATGGVRITNIGVITVATANKVFNSTVPLNIESGATLANGGFAISGGSTLNVAGTGALLLSGSSIFPAFATIILASNCTVNYNGAAQTVAVQNYGNLLLSGSGNKTFVGATAIAGGLGISGTAVAILLNGTTSTSASLTLGGVLQTALGSYGGTGSTATNKNGTWFGATTTGIINILTVCLPGTWLGITNTDWNTVTNWCGGNIPNAGTNVTIGMASNQPVIGVLGGLCNTITITAGATLTISGSNTLNLSGNWTNNGTFTSNTSTVIFNGTTNQTIGGSSATTFTNLTNANSTAILSAASPITIKNILSVTNSTSVLDMGTFALTDGGAFSNTGSGTIKTSNTSITPIPSGKTWTNSIFYSNPTGGQTIVAGIYNGNPSLELDNTSGTQTASGNIVTGGQLNIDNGGSPVFDMNGNNLTVNGLNILNSNSVLDMRGATLTYSSALAMDGTVRFSGATNAKPFASGTVEYYGATQTVTNGSYFNLLFSGAAGVYQMTTDIDVVNKLNITNGAVTLKEGLTLSVGDAVTVVVPGTLTIENNASLLQTIFTGANVGDVIVKRNTTPVLEYDATFWCSPTTGTQTLLDFSPGTDSDRYNTYDSVNDVYVNENAATAVFGKGIGYSIRCPATTPSTGPGIVIPHQFVGVPNNGTFTVPLLTPPGDIGLSLIGNPYPSALNAEDFITENLYDATLNPTNTLNGTYYIWTHNTRLTGNDFTGDDYFTCNISGPTGFANFGTGNNTLPTGFIASGQGFFVENEIAGNLKFNNSMRETKNNANFYKTKNSKRSADLERHRIWINITDSALTTGNQTMVGYIEGATNNYEFGFDSYLFDDTKPLLIYSMLGTDTMAIQGRALPFSNSDTVPIGYYTKIADNVTIAINSVDGLFLDNQDIFLEDKVLNVIHDLKSDPYIFASAAGTFNNRFVLRYTDGTLGNKDFKAESNKVVVSIKNKQIKINSFGDTIDKVTIFDLLGRQIYQKNKVNSNELSITNVASSSQTFLVKTTLQNGQIVTEKIVY